MEKYIITKLIGSEIFLNFIDKRSFSNKYINMREKCWESEMKVHSGKLWNSDVYTIEDIHPLENKQGYRINMGICEYKDIVFKIKNGPDKIISEFGAEYLLKDAITTVLPYTSDYKFLFGIVSSNTIQQSGALDQIGGTLNKNEQKIQVIDDIAKYTSMEMKEELGLDSKVSDLALNSLNYYFSDGRYRFLYTYRLPKEEGYYRKLMTNNELAGVKFMTKNELIQYDGPLTNRVPYCKEYIEQIINELI